MLTWLRRNLLPIVIVICFIVTVIVTAWLLLPALSIPVDPDNRTPAFAAALALTGVLVTAGVTLIGIILRQSNDARTRQLAKAADKRAALEQRRLQMQAALETVKLLAASDGTLAPREQISAALIVLSKLGETQLAIDLAAELWPKEQISASAATYLCDAAFASKDDSCQIAAATLLYNNWTRLRTHSDQVQWVSFGDRWPESLNAAARSLLVKTLTAWLKESPAVGDDFRVRLVSEAATLEPLSTSETVEERTSTRQVAVERRLDLGETGIER